MEIELTNDQWALLRAVVEKRCPAFLERLIRPGQITLSQEESDAIRQCLAEELCETGFGGNDEPNQLGHALEELIDLVGIIDKRP